jgi:transcriptional regulator NrdR family protein
MKCPVCKVWSYVLETRQRPQGTYRRYECANGCRFTTNETAVKIDAKATK